MSEQQTLPAATPDAAERRALLEAIIYVAEEPLTAKQIAEGLDLDPEQVAADLDALIEECRTAGRGIEIRVVAKGYKMSTKPEHHDAVRKFVKTLQPKLTLSLPALETLSVIAYKQPATLPEIQAVRGVNSNAVIHTLLNRKLVATAGRKHVMGRPMQYKTTKEFLVQFGLKDLTELPTLKELEELGRAELGELDEPGIEEPGKEEPSNEDPGNGEPSGEVNAAGATEAEATPEEGADAPGTEAPSSGEPSREEPNTEEPSTEEPSSEEPSTEAEAG